MTPGGDEAKRLGCSCRTTDGGGDFFIAYGAPDCPVHGQEILNAMIQQVSYGLDLIFNILICHEDKEVALAGAAEAYKDLVANVEAHYSEKETKH